jgi:ADP-heptose:LPS heptosyltransferase
LVPGATKPANRWEPGVWARLANRCVGDLGARLVLVGSAAEATVTAQIAAQAGVGLTDAAGKTDVTDLVALLSQADAVVACDTGPLHVAVALGRPVVALYGAADPRRTGPYGRDASVVLGAITCAPCRLRACPLDPPNQCMDLIAPEAVFNRLFAALGEGRDALKPPAS